MDDLIKRLENEHRALLFRVCGTDRPDAMAYSDDGKPVRRIGEITSPAKEAAAALTEAQATIARLEAALGKVEAWELPPSGKFYPGPDGMDSDRPAPYDSVYAWGSEGGKQAIRAIARAALSPGKGE